jgi:hypothetical protein
LPPTKSLFFTQPNCWLPIWNLTSQLFSNIYLSDFDKFIKHDLQIKWYGRYVDDFVLFHTDKTYLQSLIPQIAQYLQDHLWLRLHPKKIYLQHYSKGVLFLGTYIKPYRTYVRKRTLGYFYKKIQLLNRRLQEVQQEKDIVLQEHSLKELLKTFPMVVNSYLWFLLHHKSYRKRKQLITQAIGAPFWKWFKCDEAYKKVQG